SRVALRGVAGWCGARRWSIWAAMLSLRVRLESSHDGRHLVDPVCEWWGLCVQDPPGELEEAVAALPPAAARPRLLIGLEHGDDAAVVLLSARATSGGLLIAGEVPGAPVIGELRAQDGPAILVP